MTRPGRARAYDGRARLGILGLLAAGWFVWWLPRRTRKPPPTPAA